MHRQDVISLGVSCRVPKEIAMIRESVSAMEAGIRAVRAAGDEVEVCMDRPVAGHTSYRIGGPGKVWVAPRTETAVRRLLNAIDEVRLPLFVLGGGTNVLVSDRGWNGVVLHIAGNLSGIRISGDRVRVVAGTCLMDLVRASVQNGLAGLESMAGIPGTVGGALRMNAGAFGQDIGTATVSISGFYPNGDAFHGAGTDVHFGYRSAPELENVVITSAELRLRPGKTEDLQRRVEEILLRRAASQPLAYPSCGSVFKRPPGDYAGRLIEAAGLKGMRVGGAMVSTKHAGFIVNMGGATARDVYRLIGCVQAAVKKRFGVALQPEVKMIGDFPTHGRCG
jgi:UDP-N-acetylmuramate dehydrogenase